MGITRKLFKSTLIAATLFTVAIGSSAVAGPDKKNKVSGQTIHEIYSGKTWMWSKGGSYWGRDSSFQAIWGTPRSALASGMRPTVESSATRQRGMGRMDPIL